MRSGSIQCGIIKRMVIVGLFALVALLSYLIGRAADLVIVSTKSIGKNLGVKDFWLGLILGLMTSAPEMTLGIESQVQGTGELSLGNLMGGVLVLLGLVCGLSVALQRELSVAKDFAVQEIAVIAGFIALPLALASDGVLSLTDGLLLVTLYAAIVFMLMERHRGHGGLAIRRTSSNLVASFKLIAGILAVVVLARLMLWTALEIASHLHVGLFIVGALIISLGTNLPEITLAFRAWRTHARDLSLGNLVGSAFANGLILGVLAIIKPLEFNLNATFFTTAAAMVVILGSFVWYSATERRLTRREGIALVATYLVFVIVSIVLR